MRAIFFVLLFLLPSFSFAYQIVTPKEVKQGDPLHVFILGTDSSRIVQIEFAGEKQWPFILEQKPHALFGVPFNAPLGKKEIVFTDILLEEPVVRTVNIVARAKPQSSFDIPQKFGGNTKKGQTYLQETIAEENRALASVTSSAGRFWTERFAYPLAKNIITDTYGYSRVTGKTSVAHKGIDFKALPDTPVYAMNKGIVRLAKKFSIYGNTVVIDHGNRMETMYMHLNKIVVLEGSVIEKGQLLGYSGSTGYANGPHLHVSVRVSGTSVDPIAFMRFVGAR